MIGKLSNRRMWAAAVAAAGLALASFSAPSAEAALITFDLRATSSANPKAATVQNAGDTVTLQLWAVVANGNGNNADDGFGSVQTSIVSTESAVGALGNIAPVTLNTPFIDGSDVSKPGSQNNLDTNVGDLELGGTDQAFDTGYVIASTGIGIKYGSGNSTAPTEFLLGSTTWTYSGLPAVDPTNVNFALRNKTTGTSLSKLTVTYATDGVTKDVRGDDANTALGVPVAITVVPEPASLGLLGLAGAGLLARRRRA